MEQFIDETGELEEIHLQSSYEKHMPSGRRKPKSYFSPGASWLLKARNKVKADGILSSFWNTAKRCGIPPPSTKFPKSGKDWVSRSEVLTYNSESRAKAKGATSEKEVSEEHAADGASGSNQYQIWDTC